MTRKQEFRSAALSCAALLVAAPMTMAQPATPEATKIEQIVVTATRIARPFAEAPAGTTVLSREDIARQTGAEDFSDFLRLAPGVTVLGQGREGRSAISVRGLDSRHTLILVDGRRLPNTDAATAHSDFRSHPLPAVAVERVEIVRGPMSGLYGSDAMGGVINIITRQADEGLRGALSMRGGTAERGGDDQRTALSLSGRLPGDIQVMTALEAGRRDPVTERDTGADEIEGRRHWLGFAQARMPVGEQQALQLRLRGGEDRRRFAQGADSYRRQTIEQREAALGWEGSFDAIRLEADIYESRTDVFTADGALGRAPNRLRDRVAEARVILPWFDTQTLATGFEYRHERFGSNNLPSSESAEHRRLYLQNESRLVNERLLLGAGVSVLDHSRFDTEVSPRVTAAFRLTERWHLKGAYGEAYAVPTMAQSSPDFLSIGGQRPFDLIGNPALEPETSEGYELGLTREGARLTGGVALFRNDISNLITTHCVENCVGPPTVGPTRVRQYVNLESARTEGVELFATAPLARQWQATVNYTRLRARDRDSGEHLEGRPRDHITVQLRWQPLDRLHLDVDSRYIGRQHFDGTPASGYTLNSVRLGAQVSRPLQLNIGVENVGNIRPQDRDIAFNYNERGRFIFAALEYTFGEKP